MSPPLIPQDPVPRGLIQRVAHLFDATAMERAASPAGAAALRATLPGPSRRITVEPLTVPRPAPIPMPAPPEVEPSAEPGPVRDPMPAS